MNKIITEELIKQIRLMNYDRSMTLLEQKGNIEKEVQKTDRLGSEFRATPKIFSDPVYREYQNLSPEEKQKRENEFLNKKWKSRLCTTNAQQKGSVYNGEYYVSHEDFCKPFGGPQVYRTKSEGKSFLGISEKDVLGEGFFCGCKVNGQTFIGDKTVKVNEYLNRPMTEITYPIADFLSEPHNIAMIASIAFSMFGGGIGQVFSLVFDAIDVGLFIEEGDYFMAGLAIIFAVIPIGDLLKAYLRKYPGAKSFTKKTLTKILEKLKIKKPLTPDEKKILDAITSAKLQNKAFWKMVREKIRMTIMGKKPNYVVAFIVWLVKKGILTSQFLLKWGLIIGGVFYSWYKIAQWLGIKPKDETKSKKQLTKSDFAEMNVLSYLKNMSSKGYTYSTKLSGTEKPEVAALQYTLYAGGYFTTNKVKWGYYDDSTKKAVENYQQKNSLTKDGIAGPNTIKSLIEKIKNDKITDFSKPESIARYNFKKDIVKVYKEVDFTGEEFIKSYEDQKLQVLDSIYNELDQIKESINIDSLKNVWGQGEIKFKIPEIPK
jgi:hypothetical protein